MRHAWTMLLLLAATALSGQATTAADREAVLRYGIETEVLDLVRALRQEKNTEYKAALATSLQTATNDDLKEALLLYFLELKDNAVEDQALKILEAPDKKPNSLLLNAVSYLGEIRSSKAAETLLALVSGKNKVVALSAIRTLGKLGASGKTDDLLKVFQDPDTDPNFKPDLIWALGELKAGSALDVLLKDYDDDESQPLLRRSLLEAFGKIGDARAWDRVEAALKDPNTDLRAAAVATMAQFPGKGDPLQVLESALRDPQPAVRVAAAQGAKTARLGELKDLILYRVKKDPDAKVRVAALQALAAYDDGPGLVTGLLADAKTEPGVWREALNLSLDKKFPGTFDALKAALEADAKDKFGGLSTVVAAALLPQRDQYRALFGLMLSSEKAPTRATALRAIGLGKYTEYEPQLKAMAANDKDAGVKAQADTILKDWSKTPPP